MDEKYLKTGSGRTFIKRWVNKIFFVILRSLGAGGDSTYEELPAYAKATADSKY